MLVYYLSARETNCSLSQKVVARMGAAAHTRRCSTGSFSNMSGGRVS